LSYYVTITAVFINNVIYRSNLGQIKKYKGKEKERKKYGEESEKYRESE
jgi:hypothetical protein